MSQAEYSGPSRFGACSSVDHGSRAPHVVLVPVGAVEQHGPHLPVGTDAWIAAYIAERVATEQDKVLVAEPLAYGSSGHHQNFAGTISLRPSTAVALAVDVATSVARNGDVPVFVNGHGGNRPPLAVALQEPLLNEINAWSLSYFDGLDATVAELFSPARDAVGHACAMETSIVASLWPQLLQQEWLAEPGGQGGWPDPFLFPAADPQTNRRFEEISQTGVVGRPDLFSADAGRRLLDVAIQRIGNAVQEIHDKSVPSPDM
jgi:creatinine amidohydrolase